MEDPTESGPGHVSWTRRKVRGFGVGGRSCELLLASVGWPQGRRVRWVLRALGRALLSSGAERNASNPWVRSRR